MNEQMRECVARVIWNIRRDDEDRCDMELEDMGRDHSVWREADAVLAWLRSQGEPMFWVRLTSDGGYEGPIHNDGIERVRRQSGAWNPLFLAPQPAIPDGWQLVPKNPTPEMLTSGERESDNEEGTYETVFSAMIAAAPGTSK